MTDKSWKEFKGEDCPACGDGVEVLTDSDKQDYFYDSDESRCTGCGLKGWVTADDGAAWLNWEGEDD